MQPGAHYTGYSTDGSYASKLRRGAQGLSDSAATERKQGQALLSAIHEDQQRLSPKLRNLAEFCLKNVHALHRMRIVDLADRTDNIPSTVVRFAKRYGYLGFHDFKLAFLPESVQDEAPKRKQPIHDKTLQMHAALWELELASSGALALKDVVTTTSFQQAVRWARSAGLIGLLARSQDDKPIAMHLETLLSRLHRPTTVLTEKQYLQGNFVAPVDVLFDIDIGLEGRSPEYAKVLPTAVTKFVRITASPSSAFSTNVMSHLGLFSYADFPEHLALAGIALANALCACLRESCSDESSRGKTFLD